LSGLDFRVVNATVRNVLIIGAVALAVAVLPGGSTAATFLLAMLSLGFIAAIGLLGYRMYMEHQMTLWSMSAQHRAQLYGGIAVATMTLIATSRLWNSGFGIVIWFVLLGGSALAVYNAWVESRRYSV
jgi:hypothetical protein